MKINNSRLLWAPMAFYMNILYCFGASIMDSFVVYPGWEKVSHEDFLLLHRAQGTWIINAFVIPLAITTLFNLLLFWVRPVVISRKPIALSLVCMLTNWIMSALVQIPIHQKLEIAYDALLINRLLLTNYIRVAIQTFQLLIVYRMMSGDQITRKIIY